jgi:hypothetical protein
MTELEARNLKVGDMILFYDDVGFNKQHHLYAEEVKGITCGVDIGLVLENNGNHARIDWFSEEVNTIFIIGHTIWERVEKA